MLEQGSGHCAPCYIFYDPSLPLLSLNEAISVRFPCHSCSFLPSELAKSLNPISFLIVLTRSDSFLLLTCGQGRRWAKKISAIWILMKEECRVYRMGFWDGPVHVDLQNITKIQCQPNLCPSSSTAQKQTVVALPVQCTYTQQSHKSCLAHWRRVTSNVACMSHQDCWLCSTCLWQRLSCSGRGRTSCMSLQQTTLASDHMLPNRTTESFQMEAGPPNKQRIQMELRKGNTVLIYFRSGVDHYQCVLIALASDLSTNKALARPA